MKNKLIYKSKICWVEQNGQPMSRKIKPDLGFNYEGIEYDENSKVKYIDNKIVPLTKEECQAIENYIASIEFDEAKSKQAKINFEARQELAVSDWKVLRELERKYLKDTDLNIKREKLRASVKET
jgi:hypothetical protein